MIILMKYMERDILYLAINDDGLKSICVVMDVFIQMSFLL